MSDKTAETKSKNLDAETKAAISKFILEIVEKNNLDEGVVANYVTHILEDYVEKKTANTEEISNIKYQILYCESYGGFGYSKEFIKFLFEIGRFTGPDYEGFLRDEYGEDNDNNDDKDNEDDDVDEFNEKNNEDDGPPDQESYNELMMWNEVHDKRELYPEVIKFAHKCISECGKEAYWCYLRMRYESDLNQKDLDKMKLANTIENEDEWDEKYLDLTNMVYYDPIVESMQNIDSDIMEQVIEQIGLEKAQGSFCKLAVEFIPGNRPYHINEYDGLETVWVGSVL